VLFPMKTKKKKEKKGGKETRTFGLTIILEKKEGGTMTFAWCFALERAGGLQLVKKGEVDRKTRGCTRGSRCKKGGGGGGLGVERRRILLRATFGREKDFDRRLSRRPSQTRGKKKKKREKYSPQAKGKKRRGAKSWTKNEEGEKEKKKVA